MGCESLPVLTDTTDAGFGLPVPEIAGPVLDMSHIRERGRGIVEAVMITCPVTERPVNTGITINPASFATLTVTRNRVWCEHCNREHTWSTADAYLESQPPKPPPSEDD